MYLIAHLEVPGKFATWAKSPKSRQNYPWKRWIPFYRHLFRDKSSPSRGSGIGTARKLFIVHPTCSAAPGHLSFRRKTSPTAFEVKQKNEGICMCLGCFVEASKLQLLWIPRIPGNAALLCLIATASGFHKYTHVLFHRCPIPPLRVIDAAWKDQGSGSTHTKYFHSTLRSVSILYPSHCAWYRLFASTLLPHVKRAFA